MATNGIGGALPRTNSLRGADSAGASASHGPSADAAPAALGKRSRAADADELGPPARRQASGAGSLAPRRAGPVAEAAGAQGAQVEIQMGLQRANSSGSLSRASSAAGHLPEQVPVPARSTAADLKAALAVPPGQQLTPAQQLQAFDTAVSYQENPARQGDVRTAVGNAALTTGVTAAVTFGSTRYSGTSAAGAAAATPNPVGNQFINNALGATLGTVGHMVSQAVVTPAVDTLLNKKMAPIPSDVLVPQTGAVISENQQAVRTEIEKKQAQLTNIGSASNALTGSSTFAGARLVASAAQAPVTGLAGWGATAAVSAAGGAALGAIQAQRQSAATHAVPNPLGEGHLDMKLFYPKPTDPSFKAPWVPKTGTVAQQTGQIGLSAAARAGNLFVAGVPLQAAAGVGSTVAAAAGGGASGIAAQTALNTAAMFTGAGAYFVGLPHVGKVDAKTLQPAPPEPPV